MKQRLVFNIEHGLFNTQYMFVISQYNELKITHKGRSFPLVTRCDLFINNELAESQTITKHVNDQNQDKLAFYKVLDKLVFNRFVANKSLRTKIYTAFREKLSEQAYLPKEEVV